MSERRWTDKPDLNPEAVRSLPDDHAALRENRTLFPTTVVTVTDTEPDRLLVSGDNNRKIGATVEKGAFKGYAIYMLTLEERATCPTDCEVRAFCYGNGMQLARRHKIGDADTFYDRLGLEIAELTEKHEGVLVRLHVLGDFPDVEYVSFWKEALDEWPNLACYGYTHRSPKSWGGDEIGDAIQAVKDVHGERFRIRWSGPVSREDAALVIDFVPQKPKTVNGEIVCPAQTDATACCATCALCWEQKEPIAFVKHGPKSGEAEAQGLMKLWANKYAGYDPRDSGRTGGPRKAETKAYDAAFADVESAEKTEGIASEVSKSGALEVTSSSPEETTPPDPGHKEVVMSGDRRRIHPVTMPKGVDLKVNAPAMPEVRTVDPSTLIVEASYQRDLSGKSMKLIRSIVGKWDWAKFKPPICAETPDGLFVIDGQHTAIAAASHPGIEKIPVMVVQRPDIEDRAAAFVSQNRDRLTMSPLQVFHAELVAGDKTALGILRCVVKAGASVPRNPPQKGKAKPGEVISASALHRLWKTRTPEHLERVLHIAVLSGKAPITTTLLYGIDILLTMEPVNDDLPTAELDDEEIAWSIARTDIEKEAAEEAAEADISRYHALAGLLEHRIWASTEEYNEQRSKNAA